MQISFPCNWPSWKKISRRIIKSPVQGRNLELADANALYMREGDKIARIHTDDGFEVEADIPADYIGFLSESDVIYARLETASRSASGKAEQIKSSRYPAYPEQPYRYAPCALCTLDPLPALARAENTALSLSIQPRPLKI